MAAEKKNGTFRLEEGLDRIVSPINLIFRITAKSALGTEQSLLQPLLTVPTKSNPSLPSMMRSGLSLRKEKLLFEAERTWKRGKMDFRMFAIWPVFKNRSFFLPVSNFDLP